MGGLGEKQENFTDNLLDEFIKSGIYKLKGGSNAMFLDPVRILNRHYGRFRVSSSSYYTRFCKQAEDEKGEAEEEIGRVSIETTRKRKRKQKQKKKEPHILNDKEELANRRHQEARSLLVKAYEALLEDSELLEFIHRDLRTENCEPECRHLSATGANAECSFIELGKIWQAPLFEVTLRFNKTQDRVTEDGDSLLIQDDDDYDKQDVVPIFNNLVVNDTENEVEAEFLGGQYVIPRRSSFYMSDFGQIHNLITSDSDGGFNLIVIDPPWENRSAHQKANYPTLPNRYFLALPIKQLTLTGGALVALWVTNREKLRSFTENELFPAWGVRYVTTFYWLKVKADGSLVCDLDLFHHRPYECLLLGYSCGGGVIDSEHPPPSIAKLMKENNNTVIVSIPGDYSRKPPVGELLLEYVPGPRPAQCIELFAREMMAGWTSWGNEPLHFQESRYFLKWN